jgi:nucleotide-binding universal stress UspA family protein
MAMTIIVPINRSDHDEIAIKQGASLAKQLQEQIEILHVLTISEFVELERTEYDHSGAGISPDEVREMARQIADDAGTFLQGEYEPVGLLGKPAERIVSYADEQDASYIVAAGRKRSPTGKAIFGSTLQTILLTSNVPVVVCVEN